MWRALLALGFEKQRAPFPSHWHNCTFLRPSSESGLLRDNSVPSRTLHHIRQGSLCTHPMPSQFNISWFQDTCSKFPYLSLTFSCWVSLIGRYSLALSDGYSTHLPAGSASKNFYIYCSWLYRPSFLMTVTQLLGIRRTHCSSLESCGRNLKTNSPKNSQGWV